MSSARQVDAIVAALGAKKHGAMRRRRRRVDAVTLLSVYLLLLMLLPQRLVLPQLGAAGSPATLFAVLLFVFYMVSWLRSSLAQRRGQQPIRLAAVLYTCAVVAAYVSANRHAMPVLEENAADRGLIFIFGWLGVLLLAADGIENMDRLKTLIRRIVLAATAMAAFGMTQFFTGLNAVNYMKIPGLTVLTAFSDLGSRGGFNRPTSTALSPIEFGAVLAMTLPLAIHQARFAPPGLRFRRWLQVALIGATLPLTVSRSGILGLAITFIVILPTWPKLHRRFAYVVALISFVVMWSTIHGLAGTIRSLFTHFSSDSSTISRTSAYSAAAPLISAHPWFGRGFGTYLPQTYRFLDDQFLGSLIETGVIGLLTLVTLFVCGWCVARGARRATTDVAVRDLAQSLAASIVVAMLLFATFDAFSFLITAGLTFLLLGCAGAVWRLARGEMPAPGTNMDAVRKTPVHSGAQKGQDVPGP